MWLLCAYPSSTAASRASTSPPPSSPSSAASSTRSYWPSPRVSLASWTRFSVTCSSRAAGHTVLELIMVNMHSGVELAPDLSEGQGNRRGPPHHTWMLSPTSSTCSPSPSFSVPFPPTTPCDRIAAYWLSACVHRTGPVNAGRNRFLRRGAVPLGSLAEGDIAAWLCLAAEARRHLQHHAYAFSFISSSARCR